MDREENNRKRARDDLEEDYSPESKITRADSFNLELNSVGMEGNGVSLHGSFGDSVQCEEARSECHDSGISSPKAKWIQENLLGILDDSNERDIQDLNSVIKSFEEEILVPVAVAVTMPSVVDVITHSGSSQPDLGYLLEASDDELGLPPTFSSSEEERIDVSDLSVAATGPENGPPVVLSEMLGFEDFMPSYDFEFELGCNSNSYNNPQEDFLALGSLFDNSEENYMAADRSGLQWQQRESLSAL